MQMQDFSYHPLLNSLSEHIHVGLATAFSVAVSAGQEARIHDVNSAILVGFNSALFNNLLADLLADGGSEVISLDGGEQAGEDGENDEDLGEFHW